MRKQRALKNLVIKTNKKHQPFYKYGVNTMTEKSKFMLKRLKEQRDKLNARIQTTEARLKASERKKDTRRKILIGSYYLDQARKENKMNELKKLMNKHLKRNFDRELFDLEPLVEKKKQDQ